MAGRAPCATRRRPGASGAIRDNESFSRDRRAMSRSVLAAVVLSCVLLPACGDEDAAMPSGDDGGASAGPRARISWRVRCGAAGAACDADAPVRAVDHADGEAGHTVACDLTPIGGGNRRFEASISGPEGFSLRIRSATIEMDGDRIVGSGCLVEVDEPTDADLEGECSSNPPSADRPCQFQRIDVRSSGGVPALRAELRCVAVPVRGSPGLTRDVTGAGAPAAYAELELTGCTGL